MVAPQDKVLFYLFSFISLISLAPRSRCVGHLSLTDMIINIHNHLHNPNICCTFAVANVLRGKGSGGQCICLTYKPLQSTVGRHIDKKAFISACFGIPKSCKISSTQDKRCNKRPLACISRSVYFRVHKTDIHIRRGR